MSLGKHLMGLFIETSEAEQNGEPPAVTDTTKGSVPKEKTSPRPPAVQNTGIVAPAPKAAPAPSGDADASLVDALRKTIQEHNLPGFDYLEFEASLKALASVIPDESIRYRSAFATAAVQGLTLDGLKKTSQTYRDLLLQERAQFEKDLQSKQSSDVSGRKNEIDALSKEIASKAEQVKKLTDEITAAQEKQRVLEAQAQKTATALERARSRFLNSLAVVDDEIAQHQANIKTYLGGA